MRGKLRCHRVDLGTEHITMLGRRGSDLADHRRQRAAALRVVPVSRGKVSREDHLGAVGGRLLVDAREEALTHSRRRATENLVDELLF